MAVLPGTTPEDMELSFSFILDSRYIYDALPAIEGVNVEMRFDHKILIDSLAAAEYSFVSDLSLSGSNQIPSVNLGSGWTIDGGIANGTQGATLTISLPRTDIAYTIEFSSLDPMDGIGVMQYTSSDFYESIGTLTSYGASAVVQLGSNYFDTDPNASGMQVGIKLSEQLVNLTSIEVMPASATTNVGTSMDSDPLSNVFGISICDVWEWSDSIVIDGRTVRTTETSGANFLLNAPVSSEDYLITIVYKTSASGSVRQYDGAEYHTVSSSFEADGMWHEMSFYVDPDSYDYIEGGLINVRFMITSAGISIDEFHVSIDSDGDGLTDTSEMALGTSPFIVDSDSDGLEDSEELDIGTDPISYDTDADGLMDGNEQWSQTWSTDEFHKVKDGGGEADPASIDLDLSVFPGYADISSATFSIGVVTDRAEDIRIVFYGSFGTKNVYTGTESGTNLYMSFDMFSHGFSPSSFYSGALDTLNVIVYDCNPLGYDGQVQFASLQVTGNTDPLDPDTDGDGILDGEEADPGDDGWVTNPVLGDTDGDGISDLSEINGNGPCGDETDPTNRDTDNDGIADGSDSYMGDLVIEIMIVEYTQKEKVNGDSTNDLFFEFEMEDGNEFSTKRFYAQTDETYQLGWKYDYDIDDAAEVVDIIIKAWADDVGCLGDDVKLDICSDDTKMRLEMTYDLSTPYQYFNGEGDNGGEWWDGQESDAKIKERVAKAVRERANTVLISGISDGTEYGVYETPNGEYRYSADDQLYVINLNCSGSSTNFVEGMNTILLPRSVALESQINDALSDAQNITSSDILYGAQFCHTNDSESMSSSHVIASIYHDVSLAEAEEILAMATHNASDGRIGNNYSIADSNLYTLNLPTDVLNVIPTIVENAGMGDMPDFININPLSTVKDFAEAVFDFVVDCLEGLANLAVRMVELGLEVIGELTSAVASAVVEFVDDVVDAFTAMVDWVIDLVTDLVHQVVDPAVSAVEDTIEQYLKNMAAALAIALADIEEDNVLSSSSHELLDSALEGDLYWIIVGIAISVQVIVLAVTGVTNVFGCLLSIAMTLAASVIIQQLFDQDPGTSPIGSDVGGDPFEDEQVVKSAMQEAGMDTDPFNGEGEFVWALFSAIGTQFGAKLTLGGMAATGALRCYGVMSMVSGLLGAAFGVAGSLVDAEPIVEWTLGVTGLAFGFESCVLGLMSINTLDPFNKGLGIVSFSIGLFACSSSLISLHYASNGS